MTGIDYLSHDYQEMIDVPERQINLQFTPEIEQIYQTERFQKRENYIRLLMILAPILFAMTGLLDSMFNIDSSPLWLLRYLIFPLNFLLIFVLSFMPWYPPKHQYFEMYLVISSGFFVCVSIYVVDATDLQILYMGGLIITLLFSNVLIGLDFKYALVASSMVIFTYLVFNIFFLDEISTSLHIFLNNMYYLLGIDIITLVANYTLNSALRENFWISIHQRNTIEVQKGRLVSSQKKLIQAQKMESIGRLAGGIAHDYNNYLAIILGSAEYLEEIVDDKEVREHLGMIIEAANSSADITMQLLKFARRGEYNPTILDITSQIDKVLSLVKPMFKHNIEYSTQFAPNTPKIKFDAVQLQQLLMNLIINAKDAMVEGGVITITTQMTLVDPDFAENYKESMFPIDAGEYVKIGIKDTGIGMSEETISRIFEPFYTTKSEGEGTGLGLAMVYGIIKNHNGLIQVESTLGYGTTFYLFIPAYKS